MADEMGRTFEDVHERLSQIVDEVSAEDISLDDALALYEEAVKLGLSACDLSEQDVDAFLAAAEPAAADGDAPAEDDAAADGAVPESGAAAEAGGDADEDAPSAEDAA